MSLRFIRSLPVTSSLAALLAWLGAPALVHAAPHRDAGPEPKVVEPKASAPRKAPEPRKAPDLEKEIDEALKELDKLNQVPDLPDPARRHIDEVRKRLRQNWPGFRGGAFPFPEGLGAFPGQGPVRLGVSLQRPAPELIDQLGLPADQGLVITDVLPDSAAARAGLKTNDILLEFAGKPVATDPARLQRDLRELKPETPYDAVVLRRGKKETVGGITLPEAKAPALAPNFRFPPGADFAVPPPVEFPPGVNPFRFQFNAIPGVGQNEMMKVQVKDDAFTIEYSTGALKASIKGQREAGQMKAQEIHIRDGDTEINARELSQIPERYRATVTRLLETLK